MQKDVELYFYDGKTAKNYPPTEEQLRAFPAFYRSRFTATKVEHVRMQAAGSAYLLAEYLGVTSDDQLVRGQHGAPSLKDRTKYFSLSHSDSVTVLAVSDKPIGVDIEVEDFGRDPEHIVERFFPPSFRQQVQQASAEEKQEIFLECWTKLEAALKADGRGLTVPREDFEELLTRYYYETFHHDTCTLSIATPKEE